MGYIYDDYHLINGSTSPMRYPADQKAETHRQIVAAAAAEFRCKGLQGIGIAELMSQLGLTHGGFYAHFKNRDALVMEASVCAATESLDRLLAAATDVPAGKEVEAMLDFYLSPAHRDDVAHGCLLPALASEIARQSESVRNAFTESLQTNLAKIARYMPARDSDGRMAQAMTLISGMAGGVLIARAISDSNLSDVLLNSVRMQLLGLYSAWQA